MITIKGHFDGKVIVPDEPVDLAAGDRVVVRIETDPIPQAGITGAELARRIAAMDLAPLWADQFEMNNPADYVNKLRERIQWREI